MHPLNSSRALPAGHPCLQGVNQTRAQELPFRQAALFKETDALKPREEHFPVLPHAVYLGFLLHKQQSTAADLPLAAPRRVGKLQCHLP